MGGIQRMTCELAPQVRTSSPRSAARAIAALAVAPSGSRCGPSFTNSTPIIRPGPKLPASRGGVVDEAVVGDRLEDGHAGRARDRIPAVGRAVGALPPAL